MSLDPSIVKREFLYLPEWDSERDIHDTSIRALVRQQRLDLSEILSLKEKMVLDAGCGDGRITHELITHGASPVTAIDLSARVLQNAKERLDSFQLVTNFVRCDIEKLPFRAEIFDCVTSVDTFVHIPSPETAINELSRVTRKGGTAAINMTNRNPFWRITGTEKISLKNFFRDLLLYHGPENIVKSVLRLLKKKQIGRHMSEREFKTLFENKLFLQKLIKYGQKPPVFFMVIAKKS